VVGADAAEDFMVFTEEGGKIMSGQSANLSLKEAKAMQERICHKSSSSKSPKTPKKSK
jgi:hypothetical protein